MNESSRPGDVSPGREIAGITFTTLRAIFSKENPTELCALYLFYVKEVGRQNTRQVYATTGFVAKGLHWKEDKVRRVKRRLIEYGFVEDLPSAKGDDGKFGKPYIRIHYITAPPRMGEGGEASTQANATAPPQFGEGGIRGDKCLMIKPTASDRSSQSKESPPAIADGDRGFESKPKWKPESGTKEEKLQRVPTPSRYPSEAEFNAYLYRESMGNVEDHRPDLYLQLCQHKWRHWRADLGKWVRILNWKKYVQGLNNRIEELRTE